MSEVGGRAGGTRGARTQSWSPRKTLYVIQTNAMNALLGTLLILALPLYR